MLGVYLLLVILYIKSKAGDCSQGRPEGSFFCGVEEATTPFPRLLYFTLDTYLIILNVKQRGIKYNFLSL